VATGAHGVALPTRSLYPVSGVGAPQNSLRSPIFNLIFAARSRREGILYAGVYIICLGGKMRMHASNFCVKRSRAQASVSMSLGLGNGWGTNADEQFNHSLALACAVHLGRNLNQLIYKYSSCHGAGAMHGHRCLSDKITFGTCTFRRICTFL
jgi:hypothetical protein